MKIAIVQLSDIHVEDANNPILKRATNIRSALRASAPEIDAVLFVFSGDVSFSGKADQYQLAERFYLSLKEEFRDQIVEVSAAFIPGNHDLDFDAEGDVRPALIESLPKKLDGLELNGQYVAELLAPQAEFFEFEARVRGGPPLPGHARLHYSQVFEAFGQRIRINCFNTAWVSRLKERPGELLFPVQTISIAPAEEDLVISIFHHPYNWLEPNNARGFRTAIEGTSDIILTGHEHASSIYSKITADAGETHHVEAPPLHDLSQTSAFNVLVVDLDQKQYEVITCEWNGELYVPRSSGSRKFLRNKLLSRSQFVNSEQFLGFLTDPGAGFKHPIKPDLRLADIFVYPDLRRRFLEKPSSESTSHIPSAGLFEFIEKNPFVFIEGEENSGKTALAKTLYLDFQTRLGLVPLLINAVHFGGHELEDIRREIRRSYSLQYSPSTAEQFFQLPRDNKVLLLDDLHLLKLKGQDQESLLASLKQQFGRVVAFGNDTLMVQHITSPGDTGRLLAEFEYCSIKEYGYKLRGQLIERWHSIGREFTISTEEFTFAVSRSEHKINSIMDKNVHPSYPWIVLTLLQADETPLSLNSDLGSFGHLWEVLITSRLADIAKRATDFGTLYTYISRIAYHLFKQQSSILSQSEFLQLHSSYTQDYQVSMNADRTLDNLQAAQILSSEGNGYRFRYKYVYYYFVAKYFQENLALEEERLRSELQMMANRVSFEDYTSIIILFVYLTKDLTVIEQVLDNAAKIYSDHPPSDLDSDLEFAASLLKEKAKLILPQSSFQENREKAREARDEIEEAMESQRTEPMEAYEYADNLPDVLKVTIGLKYLRIMGQVLRNFVGVLRREPKLQLAQASYLLGLRIAHGILSLISSNLEQMRSELATLVRDREPDLAEPDVGIRVDEIIVFTTKAIAGGITKTISQQIGLEDLKLTFEEVLSSAEDGTIAYRLIDLAIKLDHYRNLPLIEIQNLYADIKKKPFGKSLLRDLVASRLRLFPCDARTFQRVGALLDIETTSPKFLLERSRTIEANQTAKRSRKRKKRKK